MPTIQQKLKEKENGQCLILWALANARVEY